MDKSKEKYPGRFYISLNLENEVENRIAKRLNALPWGFKTQYVVSAIMYYLENGEPGFFEDIQKLFTELDSPQPINNKKKNEIGPDLKPSIEHKEVERQAKSSSTKKLHRRRSEQPKPATKRVDPVPNVQEEDDNEAERKGKIKKALSQFEF